jgi:lactobin A/cerein 7B family class IIb bacteriocin
MESTMRELNHNEINEVNGGFTPLFIVAGVIIAAIVAIRIAREKALELVYRGK